MISRELDVAQMPKECQALLAREQEVVRYFVKDQTVLDVGCGDGRMIPFAAPLAQRYIGVDIDQKRLDAAVQIAPDYQNVALHCHDAGKLSDLLDSRAVSRSMALFSTLGCVKNDAAVLQQMARVTSEAVLFTVFMQGALAIREQYYQMQGIAYAVASNESIHSSVWGVTRAYTPERIFSLIDAASLRIKGMECVADLAYIVTATKTS